MIHLLGKSRSGIFLLLPLMIAGCDYKQTVTYTPPKVTYTEKPAGLPAQDQGQPWLYKAELNHPSIQLPVRLTLPCPTVRTQLSQMMEESNGTVRLTVRDLKIANAGGGGSPRFDIHMGLAEGVLPGPDSFVGTVEASPTTQQVEFDVTDLTRRIAATAPADIPVIFVPAGSPETGDPSMVTITGLTLKLHWGPEQPETPEKPQ